MSRADPAVIIALSLNFHSVRQSCRISLYRVPQNHFSSYLPPKYTNCGFTLFDVHEVENTLANALLPNTRMNQPLGHFYNHSPPVQFECVVHFYFTNYKIDDESQKLKLLAHPEIYWQ